MLEKLAHALTEKAIETGAVQRGEEELYLFAYQSLLSRIVTWASFLLIGALFRQLAGAVVYMVFFIPLRIYAGGYHERNYFRCYLTSVASFVVTVLLCPLAAEYLPLWVPAALLLASAAATFALAPIGDANKPLDSGEIKKYKGFARVILAVEVAAIAALAVFSIPLALFAVAAPVTVALLLLKAVSAQKKERQA